MLTCPSHASQGGPCYSEICNYRKAHEYQQGCDETAEGYPVLCKGKKKAACVPVELRIEEVLGYTFEIGRVEI
jgi:hypothetical protein